MQLNLNDEEFKKLEDALQHASMSIHHPHCTIKTGAGNSCSCHVAKSQEALNILKEAAAASKA